MMSKKDAFTLMIDSGVGGLSVLAMAKKMMPEENFLFYADAANAPYGDKQPSEILNLLHNILGKYSDQNVKAIVLACNTATSAAAAELRGELMIPVIGMEPALKPAIMNTRGKVIVIATKLTIREKKFRTLLSRFDEGREIIPLPCPGLMELVENDPGGIETELYLKNILKPHQKDTEAIVLGCTHYVFLRPLIQKCFPNFQIFDGNEGVTRHLRDVLGERNLYGGNGTIIIDCSIQGGIQRSQYLDKCASMLQRCVAMYDQQAPES